MIGLLLAGLGLLLLPRRRSTSVAGELEPGTELAQLPTIEAWLRREGVSGAAAIAGITWPNGHYSEITQCAGAGVEIGRTSSDKLPIDQHRRRQRFWYRDPYPEHRKASLAWIEHSKDKPTDAQLDAWWSKIGPGGRKRLKVDYAAITDNAPADAKTDAAKRKWWGSIGKDRRTRLRDPYEKSFGESLGDIAKAAVEPLATYVLPQALNIVVPGSGVAVTAAIVAAKLAAKAAAGKASPADLVNAAMTAAGNPDVAKVAAAVTALKPAAVQKVASAVKATEAKAARASERVAKAKMVATVDKALKSPKTRAALQRVGVPAAQVARASSMFGAMRSAATSIALKEKGDAAGAAAHARAAQAQAAAAKVPVSTAQAGGRKLYYLALTPGE